MFFATIACLLPLAIGVSVNTTESVSCSDTTYAIVANRSEKISEHPLRYGTHVGLFDPRAGTLTPIADIPGTIGTVSDEVLSPIIIGDRLFLITNLSYSRPFDVRVYNATSNTWNTLAMTLPHCECDDRGVFCMLDLNLTGGTSRKCSNLSSYHRCDECRIRESYFEFESEIYSLRVNRLHVYDPKAGTWTRKADSGVRRYGVGFAALNGSIYVIGGGWEKEMLSAVERYHPATDRWEMLAPMTVARRTPICVVVEGKIFVMAGTKDEMLFGLVLAALPQRAVEVYDPTTNTWSHVVELPMAFPQVELHGAFYVDDRVHFFGREFDLVRGASLEVFYPKNGTTVLVKSVPRFYFFLGTITLQSCSNVSESAERGKV